MQVPTVLFRSNWLLCFLLSCSAVSAQITVEPALTCEDFIQANSLQPEEAIEVSLVWSAHPVGFDIITEGDDQFVVYYDTARVMTVAQRKITDTQWRYSRLPSVTGWDSHNDIRIAMDELGYLHISGNMHNVPLIYFRSQKPRDISSFQALPMTGEDESQVTYPVFFKNEKGELFFQYRNGGSGSGNTYWNKYDARNGQWSRLSGDGLFDGEGETNAYPYGPVAGPDGYFHLIWMWRETPVANTNHNLSYMRSKDLVNWESVRGNPVTLPVKRQVHELIVDPVGPWNGLINMNFRLGWDAAQQPIISYHKYDRNGISQIYDARWEGDHWHIRQISDWPDYTWNLNLRGSLQLEVGAEAPQLQENGFFTQNYTHQQHGKGFWVINAADLEKVLTCDQPLQPGLERLKKPEREEMEVHIANDNTGRYFLHWETLPRNFDKPREGKLPAATSLKVFSN